MRFVLKLIGILLFISSLGVLALRFVQPDTYVSVFGASGRYLIILMLLCSTGAIFFARRLDRIAEENEFFEAGAILCVERDLHTTLLRMRELIVRHSNMFEGTGWTDKSAAVSECDRLLAEMDLENQVMWQRLDELFAVAGPLELVSKKNGWVDEYADLSERYREIRVWIQNEHLAV